MTSLQYTEAIENDGLTICETIDSDCSNCNNTQQGDNDNDNETLGSLGDLDSIKQFQLAVLIPSTLTIPLPEYKNSYLFAFIADFNKPPTHHFI